MVLGTFLSFILPNLVGVIYVGVGCCTVYENQLMLFSCIRIALF
jgi:hypothetical protein